MRSTNCVQWPEPWARNWRGRGSRSELGLLDWKRAQRGRSGAQPKGPTMVKVEALDDLARRIGRLIESSPARDIENNVKALLQSGLQRLDLVPREEFDLQAQVLLRSREKLEALEARVAELEARIGGPGGGN